MQLFNQKYSGESLYDLERDLWESFDPEFNPIASSIPTDEHGFQKGTFIITVEWKED